LWETAQDTLLQLGGAFRNQLTNDQCEELHENFKKLKT
jgi:hypothetical protein